MWYSMDMKDDQWYEVVFSRRVKKSLAKLPTKVRDKFFILAEQLSESGPICANWPNYSKLGENAYHCHLSYHWVACWRYEQGSIVIEVYYVGSRENAPY